MSDEQISTIKVTVSSRMSLEEFNEKIDKEFDERGIYLVYSYDSQKEMYYLQYIGKSIDLPERVTSKHEHYNDWVKAAGNDTKNMYFSIVTLEKNAHLLICEAAMIYTLQPPINTECKKSFEHEDHKIVFKGRNVCEKSFVVARDSRKKRDTSKN